MTDLQTICHAYDKVGIWYVVRKSEGGYHYLITYGDSSGQPTRSWLEAAPLDDLTRNYRFMEFNPEGKLEAY